MASGDDEINGTDLDDAAIEEIEGEYEDVSYDDFDEDFDAGPEDLDELDDDFEAELDEAGIDDDLEELDDEVPADVGEDTPRPDADAGKTGDDPGDEDDADDLELLAQVAEEEDLEEALEGLREDEFICRSCYLAKGPTQLADARRMICVDCI